MNPLPRLRSFRLRMALLSAAVSALVLFAFTGLVFATLQHINLRRLDQDLRDLGLRYLSAPPRPDRWERAAESLQFLLGEDSNAFILLVKDKDGNAAYQSSNWPAALTPQEFSTNGMDFLPQQFIPWGMGPMDKGGPGRRGFRHGPPDDRFAPNPPGPQPPREPQGPPPPRDFAPPYPPGETPPQPPRAPAEDTPFPRPPQEGQPRMTPPFMGPGGPPMGFRERFAPPPIKALQYQTRTAGADTWRLVITGTADTTFVLGFNQGRLRSDMAQVATGLSALVPAALLLIAAGSWLLSQRALRSITRLTRAVEGITANDLNQRLDPAGVDQEFNRFIEVFNAMLDRLEVSFRQALRFSADAAHELKTPLAILQGHLEQAIQTAPPESDEQRRYSLLAAEVQRLAGITRKLLLLARIDAGQLRLNLQPVDISQMIEAAAEDIEILAPHLDIQLNVQPGLHVMADPDLLRQVVQNLTSNAIKYNVKGGFVQLLLHHKNQAVIFAITNSGTPIAPEERTRVFERFYRADKAHNRRVDGVGLGLSLAHEIVRAHHGKLALTDTLSDATTFTMTLPAPPST